MILELALIVGYLTTVGLMMVVLATSMLSSLRANRNEMKRLQAQLSQVVQRIDRPHEGGVR